METNEMLLGLGDPVKVGEIMTKLGVSLDDFKTSERGDTVKDIIQFLMDQPDPTFFISKAVGSKQVDRIDFMHEYIQFHKQAQEAREKLDRINKEIETYDPEGITTQDKIDSLYNDKIETQRRVQELQSEINIYEK